MDNWTCIDEKTGEAIILINPSGLPSAVALCPTIAYPLERRLEIVDKAIDSIVLQGKWLDGWKWVKNPAFDKKDEKTTAEIKFRICKNQEEATLVANKIKKIIESEG